MLIYALSIDGCSYVYVGQTRNGAQHRLEKHIVNSRTRDEPLYWWMRYHLSMGTDIIITELEQVPDLNQLDAAEVRWIRELRKNGVVLLNQTRGMGWKPKSSGMEGAWNNPAYREHMNTIMRSDEYRKKMSRATKGKKHAASAGVSCVKCKRECKMIGFRRHIENCLNK